MGVGIKLRSVIDEVGSQDFFHAFFSTVHYHLEDGEWGSTYPAIMSELYQGKLKAERAAVALDELNEIAHKLQTFSPEYIIWNIENPGSQPPWGSKISSDITDLSNYFVTSTGRDLIGIMREALELMVKRGGDMTIVTV